MRFHIRRPHAPIALAVAALLIGSASASRAFTLQHLVAAIDVSRLAAPAVTGTGLVDELALAVPARTVLPATVELLGPTTEVRIGLAHEADMDIQVTDESGAIVCSAQVHMPAGWQKIAFSGRNRSGQPLPNGVYFYRVQVEGDILVTRVVISR